MKESTLSNHTPQNDPNVLYFAWQQLKAEKKLRNREAAKALGVSECQLVASAVGRNTTRLDGDLREIIRQAPGLGHVMALTRNEACVHEKDGCYANVSADGHVGLVLGDEIDLRLFFSQWRYAYAVEEESSPAIQRSIQIYDASGVAVHKIYLRQASDVQVYRGLVEELAASDQGPGETIEPPRNSDAERPDTEVDVVDFRQAWRHMQDTHEFFGILKRFNVTRPQALRLAEPEFAYSTEKLVITALLQAAAFQELPIMIFVGNAGCIQIHTGKVINIKCMGPWLNVLDPGFNLHLREDMLAQSWVVRKPTADGIVTSLELFDATGRTVAMLFGKRKPGTSEMQEWRTLIGQVCPRLG
jgi:putative hemin transport protein